MATKTPEELVKQSQESILAFGRIPTDSVQGISDLESSINKWLLQLNEVKWPRGLQYFENVSYLLGNHLTRFYYTADAGLGFHHFGLHDHSIFDNLVAKTADNQLIRPVETVVGMLVENRPEGRVEPNSNLPEDEDAADIAEIILRLTWEKPLYLPEKLQEAAFLGCICGTAAIEIEYTETDSPVEVPNYRTVRTKNLMYDAEDNESLEPKYIENEVEDGTTVEYRRDIQARVWSPFHLNPDPAATSPHDMVWIARSSFEDIDYIKEKFDRDLLGYFPANLDNLGEDSASKNILYWWSKFQDIIESPQYYQHGGGMASQTFSTHGGSAPNQCVLTVIDVKPSIDYPHGRTLIMAGGHLLYAGDARAWSEKYPERWHPYAFWSWFDLPGRFWGLPLLSELVPLQKKINAIDTLVHANRQFMSIGQMYLPKHSRIPDGYRTGDPGQDIKYTDVPGMRRPEKVEHVPLPAELLKERDQLGQSIHSIAASGMAGTDSKITGSALRSSSMLSFLRNDKLRSKSPMLLDWERFNETIAQNILIEYSLNLNEDDPELTRRVQIAAREHSSLAIEAFSGASLRDHHNVKIDVASAILHSPEARQEQALEFFKAAGGNVSHEERVAVMKAIRLDDFVDNAISASVDRARRVIARVVAGQKAAAYMMPGIDNLGAMLPVFQTEILSDRFLDHSEDVQEILIALFDEYAEALAKEREAQLQQQIALAQAGVKPQGGGE